MKYKKKERPCNLEELFVRYNGDVYPCCRKWGDPRFQIGHITDSDLKTKIESMYQACQCARYIFRRPYQGETIRCQKLNLELSLACQAQCAMCSAGSPGWNGSYDLYEPLSQLLNQMQPEVLEVQGGEILIQKKTMQWLEKEKEKLPETWFTVVTNASVPIEMKPVVEHLFRSVTVSFVGFQPETYNRIMGLDLHQTRNFVESLIFGKSTLLTIKFLITPLNLHEVALFYEWALPLKPYGIVLAYAGMTDQSIQMDGPYNYWQKIFDRTGKRLRECLYAKRQLIQDHGILLQFEDRAKTVFDLSDDFLSKLGANSMIDVPITPWETISLGSGIQ